jgi:hypothetical protein
VRVLLAKNDAQVASPFARDVCQTDVPVGRWKRAFIVFFTCPPNVITLSCKSRLPCRPHFGTEAAATDLISGASVVRLPCRRAVEPPEGGSAAEPGLGGFCQLVSVVSRLSQTFDSCDSLMEIPLRTKPLAP